MVDGPAVVLRAPAPGDLAFIAHRQMRMYNQEYGWDWTYEGLACEILGRFVREFEASREAAWIAARDDEILGSVFLMKTDDPRTAKLRLLYVEPSARGMGLGRRLVKTCIDRARRLGYASLTLWTNDVLAAARRVYETEGFALDCSEPHRSFGFDLIGETWTLDLGQSATQARSLSSPRQEP
jgi:GNAT superfamily N-acetyltransferase